MFEASGAITYKGESRFVRSEATVIRAITKRQAAVEIVTPVGPRSLRRYSIFFAAGSIGRVLHGAASKPTSPPIIDSSWGGEFDSDPSREASEVEILQSFQQRHLSWPESNNYD